MKLLIGILLFVSLTTSAAEVSDPHGLLKNLDGFIAGNLVPVCHDRTEYDQSHCDVDCTTQGCSNLRCYTDTAAFGKPGYNSRICSDAHFDLWFDGNPGEIGFEVNKLKRSDFATAQSAIRKGLELFGPTPAYVPCLPSDWKESMPDFALGNFQVEKIDANTFLTNKGKKISAQIVSGSLSAPVVEPGPRCSTGRLTVPAEIWLGQGVYQTEQVLKIVVGGYEVFKIYSVTGEGL